LRVVTGSLVASLIKFVILVWNMVMSPEGGKICRTVALLLLLVLLLCGEKLAFR
jgi:hypothetical protein